MPPHFDQNLVAQIPAIRSIGRARLTDRGELDDFVQETLLRAYTRRDQLGDVERLPQWVHAIARNTAINWNRDRKYLPMLSDAVDDSADGAEGAYATMEAEERFRALRAALMALAPHDREMLVAHVVDGVAYGDLQTRYGLSSSAVGVRLHRAKRRMRQRLGAMVGAAVCGVGLGARQAIGAMIMTARWKTAVLVGAVVGATVAVGVWQVAQPSADTPSADDGAGTTTATRAPSPTRPRVTTSARRAAGTTSSPAAGRGAARRERGASVTAAARSKPAVTAPSASVKPAAAAEPAQDATVSVTNDVTPGRGAGAGELSLVFGQIEGVKGGTLQVRLADGTTAELTMASGAPLPAGGTVSFQVTPESER
jgi:RNA polymerase sigma factor (sigma-70 family)